MAEIIPFKGLLYNRQKVGDFSKVISPPYDVISKNMQDELYESNDYNVIRLIDNRAEGQERYAQAAKELKKWQEDGVLVQDEQPAIYIYEQDFQFHGELMKRKGFIGALGLKPLGEGLIYPHERTMSKPKEDRLRLLEATNANLSPIFALYINGEQIRPVLDEESQNEPDIVAEDSAGVVQKLWRLTDPEKIEVIQKAMKGKELFIADGHHRYETSLMHQQDVGPGSNGEARPTDYTMMTFIDMEDEGVVIKPTHRIVKIGSMTFEQLVENLKNDFVMREFDSLDPLLAEVKTNRDNVVFGLSNGKKFYFLDYKGEPEFDLIILHRELKNWLNISSSMVQDYVKFSADADQALKMAGDDKVVFFVNATPIDTIKTMARAHQIMPQKSTYFYPKLTDGLVIRKLD